VDRSLQDPGRWPAGRAPAAAPTVAALVAARMLDADLAALLWLMVEANVPLIVASADPGSPAGAVLDAFLDLLPPLTARLVLQGEHETFDWLGDAAALGWDGAAEEPSSQRPSAGGPPPVARLALPPRRTAPPETTYLVAGEIGAAPPADIYGPRARVLIRALQRGYGLAATIRADSLEQVFARLGAPPASLSPDELRRLGVVVVLQRAAAGHAPSTAERPESRAQAAAADRDAHSSGQALPGVVETERGGPTAEAGTAEAGTAGGTAWRVAACHYVRPLERDVAGHVQRRPPAILATWDARRDRLEHFAWGVTTELAMRVGLGRDDFEREHGERTRAIAALVAAGQTSRGAVQTLLARRSRSNLGDAG
jgi:hypothetical protein